MVDSSTSNRIEAVKLKLAIIQYNYPGIAIDGMSELNSSLESVCESLGEGNYPCAFKLISDSQKMLSSLPESHPIIDWGLLQDLKTLEQLISLPQAKAA